MNAAVDMMNPTATAQPAAGHIRRQYLLGTPLCLTSYDQFIHHCRGLAQQRGTTSVDFSNTQIVTMRRHDAAFRRLTSRVDYFVPDGMPLIWCLNLLGAGLRDRVYGPKFMHHFLSTDDWGGKHYLLGGSEECVGRLEVVFHQKNPGLRIVGARNGYFLSEEESSIVEEINRISPDFIWVGLGTPRQQRWIHENRDRIHRGVIFAIGFAFDVNAGTKPDAPMWMQRLGLTWVFRLASEPTRLGPRYLCYNSLFLGYLILDALRRKAFTGTEAS